MFKRCTQSTVVRGDMCGIIVLKSANGQQLKTDSACDFHMKGCTASCMEGMLSWEKQLNYWNMNYSNASLMDVHLQFFCYLYADACRQISSLSKDYDQSNIIIRKLACVLKKKKLISNNSKYCTAQYITLA